MAQIGERTGSDMATARITVDLERDVLRSHVVVETLLNNLKDRPLDLLRALPGLIGPRKAEMLADSLSFDPAALLFNEAALEPLARAKAEGAEIVAASRLPARWAEAIVARLPMIDRIERPEAAPAPSPSAVSMAPPLSGMFAAAIEALRPHQWTKNLLVFVPILLAHRLADAQVVLGAMLAFLAFSLMASGIYLLNDLMDLGNDRNHPSKHRRPFASGRLPVGIGLAMLPLCILAAFLVASQLPPAFSVVLTFYGLMNLAYTFYLKRRLLVDVFALAAAYTLRILGGEAAAGIDPSFWLLAFSTFLFLSLALVKRYVELDTVGDEAAADKKRVMGRGYRVSDLDMLSQLGVASAFSAVLVLALYVDGQGRMGLYKTPEFIWLVCPIVLYVIGRIWVLAKRRELPDDPVFFVIRDWRSHLMGGLVVGAMLAAKFGLPT